MLIDVEKKKLLIRYHGIVICDNFFKNIIICNNVYANINIL